MLESEEVQLFSLLDLHNRLIIPEDEVYRFLRTSKDGAFSVASFFLTLSSGVQSPLINLWKFKTPPRVIALNWLALGGGILTIDNLLLQKLIIVNVCPMCWADEETVDLLFLNYRVA